MSVTMVMTWGLGGVSVPSILGPAVVTPWTLTPMPFSMKEGAPTFGRPAATSPVAQCGRAAGLVQVP